jgi:hypothetical protein
VRHWDPDGPAASVGGVPAGCRAVPLVEVVERDGELVEVRDRRQRRKTREVVLVRDPAHPVTSVDDVDLRFAVGAGRRRWPTVVGRYGAAAFDVALSLVRGHAVHLACEVDGRGNLGEPRWWQPTEEAAATAAAARASAAEVEQQRDLERGTLASELDVAFPEVADALRRARSSVSTSVLTAAADDLLAGIDHAGPRAFTQAHFDGTKAHDVRAVLSAAGVPASVLEQLGLRRGDRIGLGGPIVVTTSQGSVDLAALRGPVAIRLDQSELRISTTAGTIVVIENLQPAEVVCAKHPTLPVIYTAGQFEDDAGRLLQQVKRAGVRIVAIVDADLGGVRIARRVLDAAPTAEIIDVGAWPHPRRSPFPADGPSMRGLRALADDPLVGWFAAAILDRGYPVEQELATLDIVRSRVLSESAGSH